MFPIIYPTKDLYSEYIETSADQDTESNLKKQATPSLSEAMEQEEATHAAGGRVNCCEL